jgi:hypothetical protein
MGQNIRLSTSSRQPSDIEKHRNNNEGRDEENFRNYKKNRRGRPPKTNLKRMNIQTLKSKIRMQKKTVKARKILNGDCKKF